MGSQWDVPFWFTLQPLVGQPHVQALCQAPDTHRDAQKTKGSNFPGDPAIRTPCSHSKGAWVQSLMVNPTCLIELPKKKKKKKEQRKGLDLASRHPSPKGTRPFACVLGKKQRRPRVPS